MTSQSSSTADEAETKPDKQRWIPNRLLLASVTIPVCLVLFFLSWLPLLAAFWVSALSLARWCPKPSESEQTLFDASMPASEEKAKKLREAKLVQSVFGQRHWRLSTDGDSSGYVGLNIQPPQILGDGASRWRPLALNAFAALTAAVGAVGLELLLASQMSSLRGWLTGNVAAFSTNEVLQTVVADSLSFGALIVLVVLSAAAGWITAKVVAARLRISVSTRGNAAPTIYAYEKPRPSDDYRYQREEPVSGRSVLLMSLRWQSLSLLVALSGLSYLLLTVFADTIGQAGTIGLGLFCVSVTLLVSGLVGLAKYRTEQRAGFTEFEREREEWQALWKEKTKTNDEVPLLAGYIDIGDLPPLDSTEVGGLLPRRRPPEDAPMPAERIRSVEKYLFWMPDGGDFATYKETERELSSALSRELAYITPGLTAEGGLDNETLLVHCETRALAEWLAKREDTVWKTMSQDWGGTTITKDRAYLDPLLDQDTLMVLLNRALSGIFRDLEIGTLPYSIAKRLSVKTAAPVIAVEVILHGGITYEKLLDKEQAIADKLGIQWLRVKRDERRGKPIAVLYLCPVPPEQTEIKRPYKRELQNLR